MNHRGSPLVLLAAGVTVLWVLGSGLVVPSTPHRAELPTGVSVRQPHPEQTPPSYCGSYTATLTVTAPDPSQGPSGTHITLVGSGFYSGAASGFVEFWLMTASGTYLYTVAFVSTATAAPFTVTTDFPAVGVDGGLALGTYYIWGLNSTTPANCAVASFTLTGVAPPDLACENFTQEIRVTAPQPAVGAAGTEVTLQGAGFYDDNLTHFFWSPPNGTTLTWAGNVTTNATGGFTDGAAVAPKGFTPGVYFFWASEDGVPYPCAGAEFNLTSSGPSLQLTPTTGPVGTNVTVSGSGFSTSDTGITLTGDPLLFPLPCTLLAGEIRGNCTFQVDGGLAGPTTITGVGNVVGGPGDTATATFTVVPRLYVSPNSGPVGSTFTVNGAGFSSYPSAANLTFDGRLLTPTGGSDCGAGATDTLITLDADGAFSCTFTVPPWATPGANHLRGDDTFTGDLTADVTFTVLPQVTITSTPTTGPWGTLVTANGSGWTPGDAIDLGVAPVGTTEVTQGIDCRNLAGGSVRASGSGNFTCQFAFPASQAGAYDVLADDATDAGPTVYSTNSFTVTTPEVVSVSSTQGTPGPVSFSVSGLAPAVAYYVYLDTTQGVASTASYDPLGTCVASDTGTVTDCTVTIPTGLAPGRYYVDLFEDPLPPPFVFSVFGFSVAPPPSHSLLSGLTPLDYESLGAVAVLAVALAAVALVRRRKKPDATPPAPK